MIFVEDFSMDTPQSILGRYPSSSQVRYGSYIKGYSLDNNGGTQRFAPLPENTSQRTEIYIELADNGYGPKVSVVNCFYGILMYMPDASRLNIYAGTATGVITTAWVVATTANIGIFKNIYIDCDFNLRTVTLIINGLLQLQNASMPKDWITWHAASKTSAVYTYNVAGSPRLSNTLTKICIATDNPAGEMLDYRNLLLSARELQGINPINVNYSDIGFAEDVDKTTPLENEPSVYSNDEGSITYTGQPPAQVLQSNIYTAGYTENPGRLVIINGNSFGLPSESGPLPKIELLGDSVDLSIGSPPLE